MSTDALAAILALVFIVLGIFAFFDWLTRRNPVPPISMIPKDERERVEFDADYFPPTVPQDERGRV